MLIVGVLVTVLWLTFLFLTGLIDFDKLEGKALLIAQKEGAAKGTTTFKLKDDGTFIERNVCFGITEIKGNYSIIHNTTYFNHIQIGRDTNSYYEFVVIRPLKLYTDNEHFGLVRYKDLNDNPT